METYSVAFRLNKLTQVFFSTFDNGFLDSGRQLLQLSKELSNCSC